jgi:hypothetical protein
MTVFMKLLRTPELGFVTAHQLDGILKKISLLRGKVFNHVNAVGQVVRPDLNRRDDDMCVMRTRHMHRITVGIFAAHASLFSKGTQHRPVGPSPTGVMLLDDPTLITRHQERYARIELPVPRDSSEAHCNALRDE